MNDCKYALEIMNQELSNKFISPEITYAFVTCIEALEKQITNGWIPVTERLPGKLEEAITCNKDGIITIGYIKKREGYYTCEHLPFVTEDIVAWMPRPPKYEEVSERKI